MPLEEAVRKELQKAVIRVTNILTEDITLQCKTIYGIQPDGTFVELDHLGYLSEQEKTRATVLRDRVVHLAASAEAKEELSNAVDRMLRRAGIHGVEPLMRSTDVRGEGTVQGMRAQVALSRRASGCLRRLQHSWEATLTVDMACISRFCATNFPQSWVFFSIALQPQRFCFQARQALRQVLEELDRASLRQLWADDETIGWIYQYFNPEDERKRMRQESTAPQNSRELAVRNQFFTPRYVVEFLTDNSLGRIWYEMHKAETRLTETCRYMLRRLTEVFLAPDQIHPSGADDETGSLQDPPAYVTHRPKKDPRDLRVIDPACGSGHFLLYAFDLLALIYEEAWADLDSPPFSQTDRALREEPGLSTLRPSAPRQNSSSSTISMALTLIRERYKSPLSRFVSERSEAGRPLGSGRQIGRGSTSRISLRQHRCRAK